MLEKSDLMAIENMFNRFEEKMGQKMEQRFAEQDKAMDKKLAKIKRESKKMDVLLLDEIERNRNILEMRMDKMQQDINEVKTEVKQLHRITEQENVRMSMELTELDKRVTKLENCAMA